jgi:hypothetical protein
MDGLYGDVDARLGHQRRYRRSELASKIDRAGLAILDLRYVDVVGAVAWWVFGRQLGFLPSQPWSARAFDRLAIPLSRRLERDGSRFGQSLLCVAARRESD